MQRVWVVMGPMEARRICGGRVRLADFNRAKRFSAVEELVKVMASGWFLGSLKRVRIWSMEASGMMVR